MKTHRSVEIIVNCPMATKSTIFKVELQIADLDRNYYHNHLLTVARHPSETDERMIVRLLAFALYAHEDLTFGGGLSTQDEPDLWRKDYTGAIELWIDVGLPDEKNIRRACGRAKEVAIATYGGRIADMWWRQNQSSLLRQNNLTIVDLPSEATRALAELATRNMQIQCTRQEGELWLTLAGATIQLAPEIRMLAKAGQ